MIKKRDLFESQALYELMVHPDVFPFVRQKPTSFEEYMFMTKQTIEAEEIGKTISRTIIDEWGNPIGTINLFDIHENAGFLGTWIGKNYHGKGYNNLAKEAFFNELFYELNIDRIFMKIRKENVRSLKAAQKLAYVVLVDETYKSLYEEINKGIFEYHLLEIPKDLYMLHTLRNGILAVSGEEQLKEA
ncbi:GNAT family N-acetyltransferase [Evansella cellulosilytica]|uniref:GCN5-related N-acetyltransferase n=1 Tax=Evansella cellulosilytica (strain ATCC 21833 / DSM 2522 / FERM P-1141 / JCM 9156 / N-4) TaxID=649639 RepID=E6U0Y0_EVAC2|nr:GNAT family N-acetyltransferase [Evansella cellulosilytica]ADU30292.1 GCN5-related N-acetyltransferase [Evansella cellulosilytica DSM 2522]